MPHEPDYERTDRAALEFALLALKVCPHCRRDLVPVRLTDDVWGCEGDPTHKPATWHLPAAGR